MKDKQKLQLPTAAWSGDGFSLDAAEGQPLVVAAIKNFWAMRLDRLDADVPGRIWRTEVSIGHNEVDAAVGVRLVVIDTARADRVPTSVPRVVSDLIERPGLIDYGIALSTKALPIHSERDERGLIELLISNRRTRPVIVLSASAGISEADLDDMSSRLAGVAHVFRANDRVNDLLRSSVGSEFLIPNRGLRTFNPGFNPAIDENDRHPPATTEWIARRFGGLRNFTWMLLENFARLTVANQAAAAELPTVDQVKSLELESRLASLQRAGARSEREALLEEQVSLLEKLVGEKSQEYEYAADCVRDTEDECARLRAQLLASNQRVASLEERLGTKGTEVDLPETLDDLSSWALKHFPGRLQLLPRAVRSAKKSVYEDKRLVYQCLAKLGREYVDARRSGQTDEGIFEPLGVQLERTGSRAHLAQWKEEYFFQLRRQTEFFEWHLKKGTGHNETTTLRIYFFYDTEDEMVIVGHLTSHLTNALT